MTNEVTYEYYVKAVYSNPDGISDPSNIVTATPTDVSVIDDDLPPLKTELIGNFPNPFNPETTIVFSIGTPPSVREDKGGVNIQIDIYNIKGQKIKSLINTIYNAGTHKTIWNGTDQTGNPVSSGIYFVTMKTDEYSAIRRMTLVK